MNTTQRRRGFISWFVEPYRQIKLGLIFLLLNLFFCCLLFGILSYYLIDIYKVIEIYFQLSPDQGLQIISKFKIPILIIITLMILFVAVTILTSVKYTHQIYGPLVSINRFLDELLTSKERASLNLRTSDQLKDLASRLNQLATHLNESFPDSIHKIEVFLEDILQNKNPPDLQPGEFGPLEQLARKANQLHKSIKQ